MVKGLKEQIIRTVRLEDVVQRYTTLYRGSKSGKTKCCNCMFHADEYASFKVRVFEQTYECEMCKETGNVVQFVRPVKVVRGFKPCHCWGNGMAFSPKIRK